MKKIILFFALQIVTISAFAQKPDLTITSFRLNQISKVRAGQAITATIKVKNIGRVNSPFTASIHMNGSFFKLNTYKAGDGSRYKSGYLFRRGLKRCLPLSPGQSKTYTLKFYMPSNLGSRCGSKFMYAVVVLDYANKVKESNEGNNSKSQKINLICSSLSSNSNTSSRPAKTTRTTSNGKGTTTRTSRTNRSNRITESTNMVTPRKRTTVSSRIKTANIKLPKTKKAQRVRYIEKNGEAIIQGDIVVGKVNQLRNLPKPKPHPRRINLNERYRPPNVNGVSSQRYNLAGRFSTADNGQFDPNNGYLWNGGKVYYRIASGFPAADRRSVLDGIRELDRLTNLTFVELKSNVGTTALYTFGSAGYRRQASRPEQWNKSFLWFTHDPSIPSTGFSPVGRQLGYNKIRLGPGAGKNLVIHEILHSMGFFHEQCRQDRNNHVVIYSDNILEDLKCNFDIVDTDDFIATDQYDLKSIMHYSSTTFAKPNKNAILTKGGKTIPDNLRTGLSPLDIDGINTVYPFESDGRQPTRRAVNSFQLEVDVLKLGVVGGELDGGLNDDEDIFMKFRFGKGWNWSPRSKPIMETGKTRIRRTSTTQRAIKPSSNSFGWNIQSPLISKNADKVKIYISMYEWDVVGDDWCDINPQAGMRDIALLIDMMTGEIYMADPNNQSKQEHYLGMLGEPLTSLQGWETTGDEDMLGLFKLKISIVR